MLNIGQLGDNINNEHIKQKLAWQVINLMIETQNAFQNKYLSHASNHPEEIEEMVELIRLAPGRIKCLSEVPKGKGPILVIGSGSSLDKVVPTLKDWPHPVICSTSQASTLVKHGRTPDYIVCMDPRAAPQDELGAPDWGKASLIGHVSIPYEYMCKWLRRATGNIYLGRIMEPTYDWYSHHLAQGYPEIRHVIMPMIDSLAAEIGFVTWMGYGPIFLSGCDYSGPRFERWDWNYETKRWSVDRVTSGATVVKDENAKAMSYSSRGTLLSGLMQILNTKYQQCIYQISGSTILTQFPYVPWEDALKDAAQFSDYPRQMVRDEIEMALSVWDTFAVPIPGGWGLDYHTYIANDEGRFIEAMTGYNNQVANNLRNFAQIEGQYKRPLNDLIRDGTVQIEAGDLLMRGAEEFGDWDWHKMGPIDIGAVLIRRRWLLDEASKRGYEKVGTPIKTRVAPYTGAPVEGTVEPMPVTPSSDG